MLLIKASILTLSLFSGLSSAQPSTPPSDGDGLQLIDGQRLPDFWYAYDLDDAEASALPSLEAAYMQTTNTTPNNLAVREPVQVCESSLSRMSQCATIAGFAFTTTASIAAAIWAWSHQKDCSYHSGTIEGWQYEFHATGRNCDTTAQQKTIQGAIYHYLTAIEGNTVCGTQCLSLKHGGSYAGYLKIGKVGVFDSAAYCGPTLHFENCASGGVNSF
ncbi:hypothetical protein BO86DRAFT_410167 [Aspergillus japonicus CBS 114.51]|uniref:Secreted protein CSS2 C-terminal domain-containing protein n=2 Tax=Aspergillus TaxID=5052 RepID=A0A2V5H3I7_ASPV1|nr:hypothetical protein BO86DRAFT_410167 [Aspergillus japonicus CBS 114.51]PYI18141.1 hypothetical protein BO99DRAFT_172178 [Aspergillus violaceofuscus CBS 115571]RAH81325.1 hypothetical protein BO86DRAFT_410167 [Aspergillus japonicus CBS 114.51]